MTSGISLTHAICLIARGGPDAQLAAFRILYTRAAAVMADMKVNEV